MEIITERSRRGIDAYAEPALVSAGPWQGLDAMASAERVPIRVSGAEPAAGVQGHTPRWRVRGLCRGEVGRCSTNHSYKRSSGVITLHRRRKGSVVWGHHGECGARAYNRGLAAEPPARSRGRAPGQEVKGAKPLKLKVFWSLVVQRSR